MLRVSSLSISSFGGGLSVSTGTGFILEDIEGATLIKNLLNALAISLESVILIPFAEIPVVKIPLLLNLFLFIAFLKICKVFLLLDWYFKSSFSK